MTFLKKFSSLFKLQFISMEHLLFLFSFILTSFSKLCLLFKLLLYLFFTTYLFHIMVKCTKQKPCLRGVQKLLYLFFHFLNMFWLVLNHYDAIWYNCINSCQTWRNMLQIGQTSQALLLLKWRSNSLDCVGKLAVKNTLLIDNCQYNSIAVITFDEHTKVPMLKWVHLIKSWYN